MVKPSDIKFSFIIPIFNGEDHLMRCLDSVLAQTFKDIEVICVNDASTDKTIEILSSYHEQDDRIRIFTNDVNKSSHMARKQGVLSAKGEYIWFVDADDEVSSKACEELYSRLYESPVDILHFNAEIINDGNLPQKRIDFMERFVKPIDEKLHGIEVFKECFENKRYGFNIWNKIFEANLCKKAFSEMKDEPLPKGQDKYEYFIMSYHAMSYQGISENTYYKYHFGAGVTGHNYLSLEAFERYCTMAKTSEAISDFLIVEGIDKKYESVFEQVKNDLFQDCFNNWLNNINSELKGQCFDLMVAYWGSTYVISKAADKYWFNQGHFAKMIAGSESIICKGRKVKTIATFYHSIVNGGVQRVLSGLMHIWVDMGYNVILITDANPSKDDYPIPEGIKRFVIPAPPEINGNNYEKRAEALKIILVENSVDTMVYHAWVSNILLWDLLIFKLNNVSFIIHCHNIFSLLQINAREYFAALSDIYRLCSGVITLSDVDKHFWSNFNSNVYEVINPFSFDPKVAKKSDLNSKNVLWLGRMSEEKRPEEALKIIKRVVEVVPDAKLIMVGGGDNNIIDRLKSQIYELDLEDYVEMHGFSNNVFPLYQSTSVFLNTSVYEGFLLTLMESGSAGLPCVMYELPYLTMTRESKGIIQVPQKNVDMAANAIIELLINQEYRRSMGDAARECILRYADYDFTNAWKNILESTKESSIFKSDYNVNKLMWDTMIAHYRLGASKNNRKIKELTNTILSINKNINRDGNALRKRGLSYLDGKGLEVDPFDYSNSVATTKWIHNHEWSLNIDRWRMVFNCKNEKIDWRYPDGIKGGKVLKSKNLGSIYIQGHRVRFFVSYNNLNSLCMMGEFYDRGRMLCGTTLCDGKTVISVSVDVGLKNESIAVYGYDLTNNKDVSKLCSLMKIQITW